MEKTPQTLASLLIKLTAEAERLKAEGIDPAKVELRIRNSSEGTHHEIDDIYVTDAGADDMDCRLLVSF